MSAERIKQLLIKRKGIAARLAKVKRPTDKTKRRIARNTERIAGLTTKLKVAVKRGASAAKTGEKTATAKKSIKLKPASKTKRPSVDGKKTDKSAVLKKPEAETGSKTKTKNLNGVTKIAENRVNAARKAYTEARLNAGSDPAKLAKLKANYQESFRKYMKLGRPASHSGEIIDSGSKLPGRFDPIVLAYNHIFAIKSNVTKL